MYCRSRGFSTEWSTEECKQGLGHWPGGFFLIVLFYSIINNFTIENSFYIVNFESLIIPKSGFAKKVADFQFVVQQREFCTTGL